MTFVKIAFDDIVTSSIHIINMLFLLNWRFKSRMIIKSKNVEIVNSTIYLLMRNNKTSMTISLMILIFVVSFSMMIASLIVFIIVIFFDVLTTTKN